ncbi:MAG TPA: serine hydrolase domain-containing protein [Longimicrobiales bacterium]
MGNLARVLIGNTFVTGALLFAAAEMWAQKPPQARVDSVFTAFDRKDSPGCALGVYQDDRIVYARGYGMADLQAGLPITSQSVFDIGSTSKQFTAASIVLLAQQGKLSLDDDVRRYIPELPLYSKPITIRHLLHHTSGLRDYIGLMTWGGASIDDHTTAQQALAAIVRQKGLNFEPGAEYLYSNSGYFLLSQIVERVSGKSLRTFAQEQIFEPLGMKSTHFHDDHRMVVPNRAIGYEPTSAGFEIAMSRWEQTGDGAVHTTVEDLLLWDRNFYQPKVGGAPMLTTLLTSGLLNSGDTLDYALGLVHETFRGLKAVSHGGSWAGYRAELVRFPEQHFSVATLCNLASANPSQLARSVAEIYLADKMTTAALPKAAGAARISVPATTLSAWTGDYRNPVTGTPRVVSMEGEKLLASFGPTRQEMIPTGANEFTVLIDSNVLRLVLERGSNGERRMRQFLNGRQTAVFEEVHFVQPTAAELEARIGEYFSEELQATFKLTHEGAGLVLHGAARVPIQLRALATGDFVSGPWSLKFARDAQGHVAGFLLSAGRVRGITFTRK